jgi:hypothetical protein
MDTRSREGEGISLPGFLSQCFLISVIFYLWSSPLIQPVKIMAVLFHELSHGLMALASGGKVLNIVITADEGGACETEGGMTLLIVSAGYLGSMLFGGLILYLSKNRGALPVVYTLLTLLLGTAIFTVLHEPYSRTFAMGLAGSFIFAGLLAPTILGALFLRILGTVSCLYSLFDIYWDILANNRPGYTAENDAVAFSSLTGIPAEAVGLLWLGASTLFFFFILKIMISGGPEAVPQEAKTASAQA